MAAPQIAFPLCSQHEILPDPPDRPDGSLFKLTRRGYRLAGRSRLEWGQPAAVSGTRVLVAFYSCRVTCYVKVLEEEVLVLAAHSRLPLMWGFVNS